MKPSLFTRQFMLGQRNKYIEQGFPVTSMVKKLRWGISKHKKKRRTSRYIHKIITTMTASLTLVRKCYTGLPSRRLTNILLEGRDTHRVLHRLPGGMFNIQDIGNDLRPDFLITFLITNIILIIKCPLLSTRILHVCMLRCFHRHGSFHPSVGESVFFGHFFMHAVHF